MLRETYDRSIAMATSARVSCSLPEKEDLTIDLPMLQYKASTRGKHRHLMVMLALFRAAVGFIAALAGILCSLIPGSSLLKSWHPGY